MRSEGVFLRPDPGFVLARRCFALAFVLRLGWDVDGARDNVGAEFGATTTTRSADGLACRSFRSESSCAAVRGAEIPLEIASSFGAETSRAEVPLAIDRYSHPANAQTPVVIAAKAATETVFRRPPGSWLNCMSVDR